MSVTVFEPKRLTPTTWRHTLGKNRMRLGVALNWGNRRWPFRTTIAPYQSRLNLWGDW